MRTPEPEPSAGRSLILAEAIASVTSGSTRAQSLERLLTAACRIGGFPYGALAALDSSGAVGEVLHHGLSAEQEAAIGRFPLAPGVLGEIARSDVPLVYDDVAGSAFFPSGHPDAARLVGLPVRAHGRCLGLLLLGDEGRRRALAPAIAAG